MRTLRLPALLALFSLACASPPAHAEDAHHFPVQKTDAEWKAQLTPGQYAVLRKAATERPFTGALNDNHEKGVYRCAACGHLLFRSDAKFDSGTGWPSFFQPAEKGSIVTRPDPGIFGTQTEVVCANCGGHLGHVFDDGPAPTGLRYCMNSAAMRFEKAK